MPFADILEQDAAKRHLQVLLRAGSLPGALLFQGPWGVGKTRTALAFARALNCQTSTEEACDHCPSCRKALKFSHPDIRFVFPLPGGKPEEIEAEESEMLRSFAADPFHIIRYDRFTSIPIDKLRELKRSASLTHAEGRHKVFVIREADRMLALQQNALLKLLEEPPPATHLVLTTGRPQALLSTIISRCQSVAFTPLSGEAVAGCLVRERGLDPERARLAAGMAEGSLGRALILAGEDVIGIRDQALRLLAAALRGGAGLHSAAQKLAAEKDRGLVRRLAQTLTLWHGDLLRVRWGAPDERLANPDRRSDLESEAAGLDLKLIRRRIELCEALIEAMDQSANLAVSIYWFLAALREPELADLSLLPGTAAE
jgi:DNA polymerase-3 subunit delta'